MIHNALSPRAVLLLTFEECFAFRASAASATFAQFRACEIQFVQDPACLVGVEAASSKSLNHLVQAEQDGTFVVRRRQVQVSDPEGPPASPSAQAMSFVAQMGVAVALATERRGMARDPVFLNMATMPCSIHGRLRLWYLSRLAWRCLTS